MNLPAHPSASFIKRNPHLFPSNGLTHCWLDAGDSISESPTGSAGCCPNEIRQANPRRLLNKLETRYRDKLIAEGVDGIMEQAVTLRLDPPFKSYRADLAYWTGVKLVLIEVKGPHRFMEKGIAKAALAAKTYPMFRFELALWKNKEWKVTVL